MVDAQVSTGSWRDGLGEEKRELGVDDSRFRLADVELELNEKDVSVSVDTMSSDNGESSVYIQVSQAACGRSRNNITIGPLQ